MAINIIRVRQLEAEVIRQARDIESCKGRVKQLGRALAKLIDSTHTIESIDNWASSEFDNAIETLRLNANTAEKVLHKS